MPPLAPRIALRNFPTLRALALLVLFGLLVTLVERQIRWIQRLADAERAQLAAQLGAASRQFLDATGTDLARIFLVFQISEEAPEICQNRATARLRGWRASSRDAAMVLGGYCLDRQEDGWRSARFGEPGEPSPLPPTVAPEIARALGLSAGAADPAPLRAEPFLPDVPALLVPRVPAMRVTDAAAAGADEATYEASTAHGYVLVLLDRRYLTEEWLPRQEALAAATVGGASFDFRIRGPRGTFYRSEGSGEREAFERPPDRVSPVFTLEASVIQRIDTDRALLRENEREEKRASPIARRAFLVQTGLPPRWFLEVWLRQGPVEKVVTATLHRNLAISGGIIAILAAAAFLLSRNAREAHGLARQQINFVAGVSHQLRTPIAVITSAGQNLRDGLIDEPEKRRRYGNAILREGRRLERLVEQVLSYSGVLASDRMYETVAVDPDAMTRQALETCDALESAEIEVEEDLPAVLVDPDAAGSALESLIDNAIKYGEAKTWIGVAIRRTGTYVRITIADRGPGIGDDKLDRLFEPFVRGASARTAGVRGSGLGLGLARDAVQGQGGRLTIRTPAGGGVVCNLDLPIAPSSVSDQGAPE